MLTYIYNIYGIEQIRLNKEENFNQVRNISDFLQTL